MRYLTQVLWILGFSFLGEGLHALLPWPIPASIYGMVLLFLALALKLVRLDQIRETGHFLVNIMAVLFVCPAVGLLKCWPVFRDNLLSLGILLVVSTALTFWVAGGVTQWLLRRKEDGKDD